MKFTNQHNAIDRRYWGRTQNLKALGMKKWDIHRAVLEAMIDYMTDGQIRQLKRNQKHRIEELERAAFAEFGPVQTVHVENLTDDPEAQTNLWKAYPLADRETYKQVVAFLGGVIAAR